MTPLERKRRSGENLVAAAAALAMTLPIQHSLLPSLREDFGQLAEGVTSERPEGPIEAAYRMFSLPDFAAICKRAHADEAARIRPASGRILMQVGHPFAYSNLRIDALDRAGLLLPKVPIAIESEMWSDVLDVRSDHIADGTVTPVAPGTVRLRVRTICEPPSIEAFMTAEVKR